MKIKSQRDFFSGLMFMAAGLAFCYGSTKYDFGRSGDPDAGLSQLLLDLVLHGKTPDPGPGFFPLLLSVLMMVLGAIITFTALTIEADDGDPIGSIAWRPLVVTVASIAVFGVLLPRIGLLLTVPLLVFCISFADRKVQWRSVLITALVLDVFAWAVFIRGLSLTIPIWPEGFGF